MTFPADRYAQEAKDAALEARKVLQKTRLTSIVLGVFNIAMLGIMLRVYYLLKQLAIWVTP